MVYAAPSSLRPLNGIDFKTAYEIVNPDTENGKNDMKANGKFTMNGYSFRKVGDGFTYNGKASFEWAVSEERFEADGTQYSCELPSVIAPRTADEHAIYERLMEMGLTLEDDVRSIWTGLVRSNIEMLGASFRASLAHGLSGMGLDLTANTREKIESFGLLGVSEATVANYRGGQLRDLGIPADPREVHAGDRSH
jgi:hypothetical protein